MDIGNLDAGGEEPELPDPARIEEAFETLPLIRRSKGAGKAGGLPGKGGVGGGGGGGGTGGGGGGGKG